MTPEDPRLTLRARTAEYALAAVGAAAICGAEESYFPLALTVVAAGAAHVYLELARFRPMSPLFVQLVSAAAFIWVFLLYATGTRSDVYDLAHLLIVMQAARFFGPRRMTGGHEVFLVNTTLLVVAGVKHDGLGFLGWILAFMAAALWAAHTRMLERAHAPAREEPPGPAAPSPLVSPASAVLAAAGTVAATAVAAVGLGIAFFLVAPRVAQSEVWRGGDSSREDASDRTRRDRANPRRRGAVTGFSEEVSLQMMEGLKEDRSAALVVRLDRSDSLPRTTAGRILYRGLTYQDYDSFGNWRVPATGGPPARIESGGRLARIRPDVPPERCIRQTFVVLAEFNGVLFAIHPVTSVKAPAGEILVSPSGDIRASRELQENEVYEAQSELLTPSPRELAAAGVRRDALYLNPGARSATFRRLAASLRRLGATPHERVLAVRDHLAASGEFRYSLDITYEPEREPVEDFLFRQKKGHCALFASAMVLLLRQMGVPARLATGYTEGEYIPRQDHYIIRQADAHAWVEVPYEGLGWVPYDPTPPDWGARDPRNFVGDSGEDGLAGLGAASLPESYWNSWVVGYDSEKQKLIWSGVADALAAPLAWMKRAFGGLEGGRLGWAGALALLAVGLLWAALRLRRPRVFIPGRSALSAGQVGTIEFYHEMLGLLARRGIVRRLQETPAEFARGASERAPDCAPPVFSITGAFERVRYGAIQMSEGELELTGAALRGLRERLASSRAGAAGGVKAGG